MCGCQLIFIYFVLYRFLQEVELTSARRTLILVTTNRSPKEEFDSEETKEKKDKHVKQITMMKELCQTSEFFKEIA